MIHRAIAAAALLAGLTAPLFAAGTAFNEVQSLAGGKDAATVYDGGASRGAAPAVSAPAASASETGATAAPQLSASHPALESANVPEPSTRSTSHEGTFLSKRGLLIGAGGAGVGFALGGPVGALIGAFAGFAIGFLLSKTVH